MKTTVAAGSVRAWVISRPRADRFGKDSEHRHFIPGTDGFLLQTSAQSHRHRGKVARAYLPIASAA